jgi:hypothetical protein
LRALNGSAMPPVKFFACFSRYASSGRLVPVEPQFPDARAKHIFTNL